VSIKVVHRFEPRNCPLPAHRILVVTVTCIFMLLLNTTEVSVIKSDLTTFNSSLFLSVHLLRELGVLQYINI